MPAKSTKYFLLITAAILFCFLPGVLADGMIIVNDESMWAPFMESQQYCYINYSNNSQNMILTVDTAGELEGDSAVWIFPVPAKPEETIINVIKGFPRFSGRDIQEEAEQDISGVMALIRATQIYSLPIDLVLLSLRGLPGFSGSMLEGGIKADSLSQGVDVYRRVTKMGLTTELISAENRPALESYLQDKNLLLPAKARDSIGEYIGKEYSLVISWISDIEEYKREQSTADQEYYGDYEERYGYEGYGPKSAFNNSLGVFITFPTDEIYYPLKPTSIYGEEVVPAVIYVTSYVDPELFKEIEDYAEITYFYQERYNPGQELAYFFNWQTSINDFGYTKIDLTPPSKNLSEDLWIKPSKPAKISISETIVKNTFLFGLILFILISMLSSFMAALIVFRKDKPRLHWFALWGLWNTVSIIGFLIASYAFNAGKRFSKAKKEKPKAKFGKAAKKSLLLSAIIPALIVMAFIAILMWETVTSPRYSPDMILAFFPVLGIALVFYIFTALLVGPFVWGYYNDRKTMYYTAWSAGIFMALTLLAQLALKIIL